MPVELNLWSFFRDRWLTLANAAVVALAAANDRDGARPDVHPPPISCERLSAHLRRDIGLDLDRV